ncbi:hypothetical protein Tco_0733405 [Tanacetum coccineum]
MAYGHEGTDADGQTSTGACGDRLSEAFNRTLFDRLECITLTAESAWVNCLHFVHVTLLKVADVPVVVTDSIFALLFASRIAACSLRSSSRSRLISKASLFSSKFTSAVLRILSLSVCPMEPKKVLSIHLLPYLFCPIYPFNIPSDETTMPSRPQGSASAFLGPEIMAHSIGDFEYTSLLECIPLCVDEIAMRGERIISRIPMVGIKSTILHNLDLIRVFVPRVRELLKIAFGVSTTAVDVTDCLELPEASGLLRASFGPSLFLTSLLLHDPRAPDSIL